MKSSPMAAEQVDSEAAAPVLLREDVDGISTLTLNRPGSGNSLSHALVDALDEELGRIGNDPAVRVVVLAAAGRLFCTGHDLNESIAAMEAPADKLAANRRASALMKRMRELPKPIIAKVHAIATAAGCQLVASCDLAVAASDARFATPGVNIGLWCFAPQVALSRAVHPRHALQMLMTGKPVDAETAFRFGLVTEVVEPEALDVRVRELALEIASKSPVSLALGKKSFYQQLEMPMDEAYEYVDNLTAEAIQTEDAREGISAFLDKRKPVWRGR